jgi:hypothetical protein
LNCRPALRLPNFGIDSTSIVICATVLMLAGSAHAEVTWPEGQLLPSFPSPAANQDLIYLRGGPTTWQAEGAGIGHGTGHSDGDGWLCQTGVDQPGHMVYGPYETGVPLGGNTAHFRILIDNNTADNARQVTIDVRDATSGATLGTKDITRQQFTSANAYVTFDVPFTLPDDAY